MSSNIEISLICQFCGEEFTARTTVTKYCSHRCSSLAYKKKKREEKIQRAIKKTDEIKQVSSNDTISNKEYLSVSDAAQILGVERTTAYRYCVDEKIPCMRINRKIFIRKKDIDSLFENAGPYTPSPIQKQSIVDFYTIDEIEEKYKISKSLIFKTIREKNIPKTSHNKKAYYSKTHIERHFKAWEKDTNISEWYSVDEMTEKFSMTVTAVYSFVSENRIPKKQEKGKTYYSRDHIDPLLSNRIPDPSITEWYCMEDILVKYNLKQTYVSNLIYKNPIPKIRKSGKLYLSKSHFDDLVKQKNVGVEYYTMEEAMEKYNLTRDVLYYHVKKNGVPKKQEGRKVKIAKKELDFIFAQKPIIL